VNQQQFEAKLKNAVTEEQRISLFDSYAEELFHKDNYPEAIKVYS